jgi:hypothetical protein
MMHYGQQTSLDLVHHMPTLHLLLKLIHTLLQIVLVPAAIETLAKPCMRHEQWLRLRMAGCGCKGPAPGRFPMLPLLSYCSRRCAAQVGKVGSGVGEQRKRAKQSRKTSHM